MAKRTPLRDAPAEEILTARFVRTMIASLKTFGYELVDEDNIFTDEIYSKMFRAQLAEWLTGLSADRNPQAFAAVTGLIAKIDAAPGREPSP